MRTMPPPYNCSGLMFTPTATVCCCSARMRLMIVDCPSNGGISQYPSIFTPRDCSDFTTSQLLPSGKSVATSTPFGCTLIHAYAVAMFPVLHAESKLSHDNK